jgi:hypothetical protein
MFSYIYPVLVSLSTGLRTVPHVPKPLWLLMIFGYLGVWSHMIHPGLVSCHDSTTLRVSLVLDLALQRKLRMRRGGQIHNCIAYIGALGRLDGDISTPGVQLDSSHIINNCSDHLGGLLALNQFVLHYASDTFM